VKVWAIASVAELIGIIALSCQFVSRLSRKAAPFLLLMATLLILFHPATATAFFELIYSERILTLLLIGLTVSYLSYQERKKKISIFIALMLATLGLFSRILTHSF